MLTTTVTCPTCNAALKLKRPPSNATTTATCPKCGGRVPLNPATASGGDGHTVTRESPGVAHETRSLVRGPGSRDEATVGSSPPAVPIGAPTPCGEFPYLSPPQQPDEIGRLGPYRVLAAIGAGGMGAVFRAEDPHLKRLVALKVMLPQYASNATAKARFLREARAQAAVEHDHVAAIFQVGEDAGVPFIAMPLLKGQTLGDALKSNPRVPLAEAVRIAREMAEGLAAAHEQNLVHRDIKPANVWLEGKRRRVKILDFGLARAGDADAVDAVTQQGAVVGTPAYMSPEQARGETLDPRSDLFSLGVVLYQMLTGRQPFRAGSTTGLLIAVATENPPHPRTENPEVPPALDALTMRLLAKNTDDRPATAEAAVGELREIETRLGVTGLVAVPMAIPAGDAPSDPWAAIDATESATIPMAIPDPAEKPKRSHAKLYVGAGLLALFALALLAVVVLRFETENGTLVVEINDKDVEARIKNGKLVIVGADGKERYTLTAGERNKQLETGAYKIRVEGADGLVLDTTEFTLKKGGQVTVRVTLDPKAVAKKKDPPAAIDPDRKAAEYVLSIGGSVRVNDEERDIKALAALPGVAFRLTSVELGMNGLVSDAGLVAFERCRHVTHLSVNDTQVGDAGVAHFKDCKELMHLDLNRTKVTDTGLAHFKNCTNLRILYLELSEVSDVGLVHFKDCKVLTHLDLGKSKVSDAGLAVFKDCKNLTHLWFTSTQIGDEGLAHLRDNSNLTLLGLVDTRVTDASMAYFKNCKNLTVLSVQNTKVTDVGLVNFKDCKSLLELNLAQTVIGDSGVANFKGCSNLRVLSLWGTRVTDEALANFKECKDVTDLYLTDTKVGDEGLANFKNCKNLTRLDLANTRVTDTALVHFKDCKNLKIINLFGTRVTDTGLASFKDCTNLSHVVLGLTVVTDEGLAHFRNCKGLVTLAIPDTRVTDAGLAHFKDCKNFTLLNLHNTLVSDACVADIKRYTKLTALYLQKTKVTAKGVDELKKALPKCKIEWDGGTIEPTTSLGPDRKAAEYVLSIGGTVRVNDEERDILAPADLPRGFFRLTWVELSQNNRVTDAGLANFKDCKYLTHLSLWGTAVSDAGLVHFKGCNSLTFLTLNQTGVGDAGLIHFKDCKNLTILALRGTEVTDTGLTAFKNCNKLTTLNLSNTTVTDVGLANFEGCKDLTILWLHHTKVTDVGLANFEGCKDLISLVVASTSVSDRGVAYLKGCKKLIILSLASTQVKDAGLVNFKDCASLMELYLWDMDISDAGLIHFKNCKNLTTLWLNGTQATNTGLANFKDCNGLTDLNLSNTQIGDEGVDYFKDCKKLMTLNVQKTKVTAGKIAELKKALPKCKIEWDGSVIEPKDK